MSAIQCRSLVPSSQTPTHTIAKRKDQSRPFRDAASWEDYAFNLALVQEISAGGQGRDNQTIK